MNAFAKVVADDPHPDAGSVRDASLCGLIRYPTLENRGTLKASILS